VSCFRWKETWLLGQVVGVAAACSLLAGGAGAQTLSPLVNANGPNVLVGRFQLDSFTVNIVTLADYAALSAQKFNVAHEVRYYTLDGFPLSFDWRSGEDKPVAAGVLPTAAFSPIRDEAGDPVSVYDTSFETTSQPVAKLGTFKYLLLGAVGAVAGERSGQASYYAPSEPQQTQGNSIEARMNANGQQVKASSSVAQTGPGQYTYTYTVTNETDEPVPFQWRPEYPFPIGSGLPPVLSGTIGVDADPHDVLDNVLSWSFTSGLPAFEVSGTLTGTLPGFAGHMLTGQAQFLVPVPEPGAFALMAVGLAVVAWRCRCKTSGPASESGLGFCLSEAESKT